MPTEIADFRQCGPSRSGDPELGHGDGSDDDPVPGEIAVQHLDRHPGEHLVQLRLRRGAIRIEPDGSELAPVEIDAGNGARPGVTEDAAHIRVVTVVLVKRGQHLSGHGIHAEQRPWFSLLSRADGQKLIVGIAALAIAAGVAAMGS